MPRPGGVRPKRSANQRFWWLAFAGAGFVVSAFAHLVGLLGGSLPGAIVLPLFLGLFVAMAGMCRATAQILRHEPALRMWRVALSGAPRWVRFSLPALYLYMVATLAFFIIDRPAPSPSNTGFMPPEIVPFASSFAMSVYGCLFAMRKWEVHGEPGSQGRQCPEGHLVSVNAGFCPVCGAALERRDGQDS